MTEEIKLDGKDWTCYEAPLYKAGKARYLVLNLRTELVDKMNLERGDVVKLYIKKIGKKELEKLKCNEKEDSKDSISSLTIEPGELETQPSSEESNTKQVGC